LINSASESLKRACAVNVKEDSVYLSKWQERIPFMLGGCIDIPGRRAVPITVHAEPPIPLRAEPVAATHCKLEAKFAQVHNYTKIIFKRRKKITTQLVPKLFSIKRTPGEEL
jgi:hypothetical protein